MDRRILQFFSLGLALSACRHGVDGVGQCDRNVEFHSISPLESEFAIELVNIAGVVEPCDPGDIAPHQISGTPPTLTVIDGEVVTHTSTSSSETWVIDSCAPSSGCSAQRTTLTVKGQDIGVGIPEGAFVHVELGQRLFSGYADSLVHCGRDLRIRNLPRWNGVPNPQGEDDRLWFLGVDNFWAKFDDLTVDWSRKSCDGLHGGGEYALAFHWNDAPESAVVVDPGTTATWSVATGAKAGAYRVRNVLAAAPSEGSSSASYWVARATAP